MRGWWLATLGLVAVAAAGSAPAARDATPRPGGTIVIASSEQQACLNLLVDACRATGLALVPAIKQVLGGAFDVRGDLTYTPNLVSRATWTRRPFTVTYHIRPEATWSDGRPVSARDFEFTWQAARTREVFGAYHSDIRRVVVLGPKTVKAVFSKPVANWRAFFSVILPRHALAGENLDTIWLDTIDNPKTRAAIGNGPFLIQRWERGRRLTLVRNPRYWGPRAAYLQRIVFRFMAETDYADALRRGDVHLIAGGGASAQAALIELRRQRTSAIRIVSRPGTSWAHLELRIGEGGHPALKSRLVRTALAYGLDRRAIARAVLGGLGDEDPASIRVLDSVVFVGESPYYRPNWARYQLRPAEARRLLRKAGCRRGADGVYVCGGERLALRFVTTAGTESRKLMLDLIRVQLKRIGVEVEHEFVPASVFFNTVLEEGDFDVALFNWSAGPSLLSPYGIFGCGAKENFTGYCGRGVTRALRATTRMFDTARRVRALNRADIELASDVPVIPLFQPPVLAAMRSNLRGLDPKSLRDWFHMTWNAKDWWLAR